MYLFVQLHGCTAYKHKRAHRSSTTCQLQFKEMNSYKFNDMPITTKKSSSYKLNDMLITTQRKELR